MRSKLEVVKKSKQRFIIAFFVSATGQKIEEPVVTCKKKLPLCFKSLKDTPGPGNVHNFANLKSWMTS